MRVFGEVAANGLTIGFREASTAARTLRFAIAATLGPLGRGGGTTWNRPPPFPCPWPLPFPLPWPLPFPLLWP